MEAGLIETGLAHAAVERSIRLIGDKLLVLFGRRRMDDDVLSGLIEDVLGEFGPGAEAFVGGMVGSELVGHDHVAHQLAEVVGVGRTADLVADDVELGLAHVGKLQHGLDEVVAVESEGPADTDDVMFL